MTTKVEKQAVFEGSETAGGTPYMGDDGKNATARCRAVLPQGGLMIGKDWKLYCCDSLNITVARRQKSKSDNAENWINTGYFSTVSAALHFLVEQGIKDTGLKDMKTVVAKIDELKRDIDEALKAVPK